MTRSNRRRWMFAAVMAAILVAGIPAVRASATLVLGRPAAGTGILCMKVVLTP